MIIATHFPIPNGISLLIIVTILTLTIWVSLAATKRRSAEPPAPLS
jgi:hypothetical protein